MADLGQAALLIVDMQNDFLAQGGYYDEKEKRIRLQGGELRSSDTEALEQLYLNPPSVFEIREGYNDFLSHVVETAAAGLAAGMLTVFIRAAYDPTAAHRPPLFLDPTRRDYGCHPGSWGAELIDPIQRLASHAQAQTIEKPTFDAFFETGLSGLLRQRQIKTVYLAGLETNVCVLFSALSALSNGFQTVVLEDCVTTSMLELQAPALQIIEAAKGRRMTQGKFLQTFEMKSEG